MAGSVSLTDPKGAPSFPVIAPLFKTPKSDGPYRDQIIVEILSIIYLNNVLGKEVTLVKGHESKPYEAL